MALNYRFASEIDPDNPDDARWIDYIIYCATHPAPLSIFETNTAELRKSLNDKKISRKEFFALLLENNYDGLLFTEKGINVGHVFWQVCNTDDGVVWKIFSWFVHDDFQGNGYGTEEIRCLLCTAHDRGIKSVILGDGNNDKTMRVLQKILMGGTQFAF